MSLRTLQALSFALIAATTTGIAMAYEQLAAERNTLFGAMVSWY